ncbi:MAG: VOC family protein [Planctomycetaceae bacterium]
MKIEHLAWNVEDPISVARWYVENLGLSVKRKIDAPPWIHFLADDGGTVMLELYGNTSVDVHGFGEIEAMALHLALVSEDIEADMARLIAAGGTRDGEISTNDAGDRLGMVRDPWGFCLQLVQRTEPMI